MKKTDRKISNIRPQLINELQELIWKLFDSRNKAVNILYVLQQTNHPGDKDVDCASKLCTQLQAFFQSGEDTQLKRMETLLVEAYHVLRGGMLGRLDKQRVNSLLNRIECFSETLWNTRVNDEKGKL